MTAHYEKLLSLVKAYYGDKDLTKFISTLRGEERKIMENLSRGIVTDETDEAILHSIRVLTVRMKNKKNPYGYYNK